MKYHHTAIAKGNYNWDAELFRIMPHILETKSANERDMILTQWIDNFGSIKSGKQKEGRKEIKLKPDLNWIENSGLNKNLSEKLKNIQTAKKPSKHYYIKLYPIIKTPEFKNERPYKYFNYSDDSGIKLLALFRYWNLIQYFYPYKYLTDKDWNDIPKEFIPKFINSKTEQDYKLTLLELIGNINDSHAEIINDKTIYEWRGKNKAPYKIAFIEDKAVITDAELQQDNNLKTGDIITHINEQDIDEIVKEKMPYMPASNYAAQLQYVADELLRTNEDSISLMIMRDGNSFVYKSPCYALSNIKVEHSEKSSYDLLSNDIGYIYSGTLRSDSLPVIMEKFKNTKGIIIDIRCYPQYDFSTISSLSKYLVPKKTKFAKTTAGSISNPGEFKFGISLKVGKRNKEYYKGKVIILVDNTTISAAEFQAMAFQTAPDAKVIGNTTAAANGNVSGYITLPGDVKTIITGNGIYYPDGSEAQRVGIALDMEVKPTIQGIKEGRDELLEKAIEIIEKQE